MTSVGLVTLPGDTNYGNRLQVFALQEVIASLGANKVEVIEGLPRDESRGLKVRRLAATAVSRRREILRRVTRRERMPADMYLCPVARRRAIREFSDAHLPVARGVFVEGRPVPEVVAQYEHVVVGSDQVWNPAYTHGNPEWFLPFVEPSRRVAYAASFGVPEVPNYLRARYSVGLKAIPALSVREFQAAGIVEDLAGRIAPVVLDPTMLLEPQRWTELARPPSTLRDGGYIATFMLSRGDTVDSGGTDLSHLVRYARRHGLPIVDLHDPEDPDLVPMGPLEFIGAISKAELVVTDSFHAAVFSILFHRPFLLSQRGSMNSRLSSLLRHAGLTNRMLSETEDIAAALEIHWEEVDNKLAEKRESSFTFLREALGR